MKILYMMLNLIFKIDLLLRTLNRDISRIFNINIEFIF